MAEAKKEEAVLDFIEEAAGKGFENMGSSEVATPMLLISQNNSQVVQDEKVPVGHFFNSISGKDYGDKIRIVVCHFQKCWVEWKPNGGGFVARYDVGAIPVTGDPFSGMKNPETGNDVLETWMYLCVLPDYPEDGFVVFNSTRGNLKYLKGWNTSLKFLRTPMGKPAAIYSAIWKMALGKDKNKAGQSYYSCNVAGKSSIEFDSWISRELFDGFVTPCVQAATGLLAQANVAQIEDKSATETDAM